MMIILNLMRFIMRAVMIGSFIYSINIAFGYIPEGGAEVIGVWIASAAIGATAILYTLNVPEMISVLAQIVVGLTGFTAVAIYIGWIGLSVGEVAGFALVTLVLMGVIIGIQYFVAVLDSRKINKKLNRDD